MGTFREWVTFHGWRISRDYGLIRRRVAWICGRGPMVVWGAACSEPLPMLFAQTKKRDIHSRLFSYRASAGNKRIPIFNPSSSIFSKITRGCPTTFGGTSNESGMSFQLKSSVSNRFRQVVGGTTSWRRGWRSSFARHQNGDIAHCLFSLFQSDGAAVAAKVALLLYGFLFSGPTAKEGWSHNSSGGDPLTHDTLESRSTGLDGLHVTELDSGPFLRKPLE